MLRQQKVGGPLWAFVGYAMSNSCFMVGLEGEQEVWCSGRDVVSRCRWQVGHNVGLMRRLHNSNSDAQVTLTCISISGINAPSLCNRLQALLATEGVALEFTDGAVKAVARAAEEANRLLDNIGARRLHTVLVGEG